MNKLLQIKKNILLFILFFLSFILIIIATVKKNFNDVSNIDIMEEAPSFDIKNPSFTIKNKKEKISVKAERGNFLTNDLILLEKNVVFQSPNFKILTDKVYFNQKDETAASEAYAKFQSDGTIIKSEGFKITENGDIILSNGKTILTLNK